MTRNGQGTLPLSVHNTGFLLDKLGQDCAPLQFLRELTQNAIEAIERTPEGRGEIHWDVDWLPMELGERQTYKLSITDNGCGMTGPEMERYINQLSSSASEQSTDGNYGVGAKIAAATRNHAGLIYLSWKEGQGALIHLWRDPQTGQYGLRQMERPDGSFGHYGELEDDVKPRLIDQHGTKIVLLGNAEDDDTVTAPPDTPTPSTWIAKYLNTRYFRIPDGVTIKARQGWTEPRSNTSVNVLRTVEGQAAYLEKHQRASGQVELHGATAWWWILREEKALSSNSGYVESSGHVAALHKDELYELSSGRSGQYKLQQFGVIYGQRQVVIYIEPRTGKGHRLTTNTARTQLLLNSEPLPWTEWMAEFRSKMPTAIAELMDEIASKASESDHSRSIRDRLKGLLDLYKVTRYKPTVNGQLQIGTAEPNAGGAVANFRRGPRDNPVSPTPLSHKREGVVGGVYSTFLSKSGQPGLEAKPDLFPKVDWVSVKDGTRQIGDIEDKAARFLVDQNRLLINADFRVFTDMIDHWIQQYSELHGDFPGLREKVTSSVHDWFEQALTETVIGLHALKGSREWSVKQLEAAMSEEALTAVVMQRYHPYNAVKRELGSTIATLKQRQAQSV